MLRSEWRVPVACVLAATMYVGIFLAQGEPVLAVVGAAIMLGYAAVLVLLRRRSDAAAVLSEYQTDERRRQIHRIASVFSLNATTFVALIGALVEVARGREPGVWGLMCAVIGASYVAGVVVQSRRS
jgi:low temperature requirement protein LtrA